MSPTNSPVSTHGFDPERFFQLARRVGHGRALGLEYHASGDGWVELALPWRPELVSMPGTGVMATGAIVSLIDTCSGTAVWKRMGSFKPIVTVDLRLDYLRPAAKGETVVARCECYKLTRRVAFVRGVAHGGDPDRAIAHSAATFMVTDPAS
ncbi:PaaI family thioesterase [Sphingomonas sp. GCM10030256]|uniref:PaaI family thioesterase n=1 Tax=Sphingomonas sp. GCM10030256 TaxID=3273427 RepID=UPI0036133A89